MQQFKVSEAGYKKFRKKWLTFMIPLEIIIVTVIVITTTYTEKAGDFNTALFVIPILAIMVGFSFYRSLKKQKKFLLSYTVSISNEEITREQFNTPPLSISFMEIKEIKRTEKGTFMIKGRDRTDVITIPYLIEDPEAVEKSLQALAPITYDANVPFYKKYSAIIVSLLAMGMVFSLYASSNKMIAGICGPLLTGLLAWAFYQVRINKNLPESTKRNSWFLLIVMASIIYMTYAKLTAGSIPI